MTPEILLAQLSAHTVASVASVPPGIWYAVQRGPAIELVLEALLVVLDGGVFDGAADEVTAAELT